MKRRDIIRKLTSEGFVASEGGRHTRLKHPDGRMTVLSRQKTIPQGTVRLIEKQTGVALLPGHEQR